MKVRVINIGVDLYEFQVKKNFFSNWETVYSGNLPLRVSSKNIEKAKQEILRSIRK